ncbi:MAG: hypothetical protein ABIT76_09115 [Chthoniobacterales bacterium]
MNVIDEVVGLACHCHCKGWAAGKDVGAQTRRSNTVCRAWQEEVKAKFPDRFHPEHRLNKTGRSQQIDLVDLEDRVAYELKSSPNNVHMEIYRDVFKALVFNRRNPDVAVRTLVFIAPAAGLEKLGKDFPNDIAAIAAELKLDLILRPIG